MIDRLIGDPAFLPITIIFLLLVIIAIWQKLDRTVITLTIIFVLYALFTGITIDKNDDSVKFRETVQIDDHLKKDTIIINKIETAVIDTPVVENIVEDEASSEEVIPDIPDLRVNSLLMCEAMIDSLRKPIRSAKEFPVTLKRVYCYSGIRNALSPRTILYEWYFQGNYIDTIPIKIGRSVHWRSWTYKTITDAQIGNWYVVLRDEITATALDTINFTIIDQ